MIRRDACANNLVLAALDKNERLRLLPHLREERLGLGRHLNGPKDPDKMYFPLSGIVSLVHYMKDGRTGELAIVGFEGVVGSTVYLGGKPPASEAVVQVAGEALVLPRTIAEQEFRRNGSFSVILLKFSQAMAGQIAQTALCYRHHRIEQQLARWLLMSQDRLPSGEVMMTQDLIANMLGVRREGISTAAADLQRERIISYRRGRIEVLNREVLLARSCECYEATRTHYQQLRRP